MWFGSYMRKTIYLCDCRGRHHRYMNIEQSAKNVIYLILASVGLFAPEQVFGNFDDKIVTFKGLGDLPGSLLQSEAFDVSADGSVVFGTGDSGHRGIQFEGFRWEDGTMTGLKDLRSVAAASDNGLILVGNNHDNFTGYLHAFRLEDGAMTPLGDLRGGSSCQ